MICGAEISDHCIDSSEVIALNFRSTIRCSLAALCMMMLILDTRTGVTGAVAGIDICLKTLIPSLFPFFIMSILLIDALLGQSLRLFWPLAKLCRIPHGSESLLAIGFLGGYPVGAQNVSLAWECGVLSSEDAERMVVFCNNAGPAFIVGFLGQIFQNPILPWLLWVTHMVGAIIVGFLIPGGNSELPGDLVPSKIAVSDALAKSIHVMANVCGWVILFRILLEFLKGWIFSFLPAMGQVLVTGFLELANGCLLLQDLSSDGLKFILSALVLGFGGICVFLQTRSISGALSLGFYLPGKILHGCISFLISYCLQFALLDETRCVISPSYIIGVLILTGLTIALLRNAEKPVAFLRKYDIMKNHAKKRRSLCYSGRK